MKQLASFRWCMALIVVVVGFLFLPHVSFAQQFQIDTDNTLTTGLVSYWKLDGDSTDFYGSNNGTDTNIGYANAYAKIGKGARPTSANASNGIDLGTPASLIPTGDYSINLWAYIVNSSVGDVNIMFALGQATSPWDRYGIYEYNGTWKYVTRNTTAGYTVATKPSVGTSTWQMVTVVASGTTQTIYVDDASGTPATFSGSRFTPSGDVWMLGGYADGNGNDEQQYIDEVGFWDKALSEQEIKDLYNGGAGQTMVAGPYLDSPLYQYESDGTTTISAGSSTTETPVIFGAKLGSEGTSTLQLQAEVEPAGTAFTNTANVTSSYVSSGTDATASFPVSIPGEYHWQARVLENGTGATSSWELFGADSSSVDFRYSPVTPQFQFDPSSTLTTDLVSYWPMEGNSDDFFGPNDGMDTNIGYSSSYGKVNQGARPTSASATNGIDLGNASSLIPTGDYSINLWANVAQSSLSDVNIVFALGQATSPWDRYGIYEYDGTWKYVTRNTTAGYYVSTAPSQGTGVWQMITAVASGTTQTIYVNGVASTSATFSGTRFTPSSDVWMLGGHADGNTNVEQESIDEVGFWNKALSPQEIADLYNRTNGQTMVLSGTSLGSLNQYHSDATTTIAENGTTTESTVVFGAQLYSTATSTEQLQIEEEPVGTSFTGTANVTSAFVSPGQIATATIMGLGNGSYHWQARAVDVNGVTSTWQLFGPNSTSTDFTVAVEPIVIIPGIMGSILNQSSDSTEIWPDAQQMLDESISSSPPDDSYLNILGLDSDGEQSSAELYPSDIIRVATATFPIVGLQELPVYQPLIQQLTNDNYVEGTNLFVAPYDWRFSEASSASAIASVIQDAIEASPDGKIDIIAHSMGGMVIKAYLQNATDTSFIDKLILAGVPQLGAPQAFQVLNYGDDGVDLPLFGTDVWELLNPAEIQSISQNMPSVYDLLPSRRYVDVNGGYVENDTDGTSTLLDYNDTNTFMTSTIDTNANSELLSRSDTFHQSIDDEQFNVPSSSVYNIMGCDAATEGEFHIYDDEVDISPVTGDGTVPLTSATNLSTGYNTYLFATSTAGDNTHFGLVQSSSSLQLIQDILDGTLSSPPTSLATSSADCFDVDTDDDDWIVISTHSPVELNVYDEQGRHVGPNHETNQLDQEIPGSSYDVITHNDFAIVPAGGTYNIVVRASGIGKFNLDIETYSKFQLKSRVQYLSIPVSSTSTEADATITQSNSTPVLSVNANVDGTPSVSYEPTTVTNFEINPNPPTIPGLQLSPPKPNSTIKYVPLVPLPVFAPTSTPRSSSTDIITSSTSFFEASSTIVEANSSQSMQTSSTINP